MEQAGRKRGKTCHFEPDSVASWFDDDDVEHEADEPAEDCDCFICSNCGGLMMYGDGGWFDMERPHRPNFGYCPYCGARVIEARE